MERIQGFETFFQNAPTGNPVDDSLQKQIAELAKLARAASEGASKDDLPTPPGRESSASPESSSSPENPKIPKDPESSVSDLTPEDFEKFDEVREASREAADEGLEFESSKNDFMPW